VLKIFNVEDNNYVGVFISASDRTVIVPPLLNERQKKLMEETFQVPVITTTIGNTNLVGSLIAHNSHGAVVSNIINTNEFQYLTKKMNLTILSEKNNALGNSMLVREDKALLSEYMSRKSERIIQNILDVETLRGTIAGQDNIGMAAVITENGLLCHPKITEDEKEIIDEFFAVKSTIGTVNFGIPLVGAGLCANSHGAIVGSRTTGVELNRIENTLDLI